jgi:amino acid permease
MSPTEVRGAENLAKDAAVIEREAGLHRNLTARQLSMIAIGGAIGTGLFLGSALSVKVAGPGVILSYIAAAGSGLVWRLRGNVCASMGGFCDALFVLAGAGDCDRQ